MNRQFIESGIVHGRPSRQIARQRKGSTRSISFFGVALALMPAQHINGRIGRMKYQPRTASISQPSCQKGQSNRWRRRRHLSRKSRSGCMRRDVFLRNGHVNRDFRGKQE
jgi:hypothetical protein